MLRLSPIRPNRRGLPREALRVADGAFWISFVFAAALGAGDVALGFPRLLGLFAPPIAAQASVVADGASFSLALAQDRTTLVPLHLRPSIGVGEEVAAPPASAPAIAFVIDDLGAEPLQTRKAIALADRVALSFLPYPLQTAALARAAEARGHEVLLHAPMEPDSGKIPGPMALSVGLTSTEILRRLDWALSRVPGAIGVNNHEGSRFTTDRAALMPVAERLADRRLFFFDSRTTADSQVVEVARAFGVESAARDVFLDDAPTIDGVDAALHMLETRARRQGAAIAIGHPHEVTLDAIAYWIAHEEGFRLITLREAIRLKTEQEARARLGLAGR
jgi:polysaccharide deacetylase 2 family uncharacterized protein YibQ